MSDDLIAQVGNERIGSGWQNEVEFNFVWRGCGCSSTAGKVAQSAGCLEYDFTGAFFDAVTIVEHTINCRTRDASGFGDVGQC